MHTFYLQIGSNLGNREEFLEKAKLLITNRIGKITNSSDIFESEPWGFFTSNWFLNQIIQIETKMPPNKVLGFTSAIEQELGRKRDDKNYSSRTIDIDIVQIDDLVIDTPDLKVPHPKMSERRFVLEPLAQIAPNLIHPTTGKSISQLLIECPDELEVIQFNKDQKPKKGRCRI